MEISSQRKNLIKLFYTLNKTPLGETGCFSNLYYLLAAQAYSFLIHPHFPENSQSGHLWYPITHRAVLV